MAFEPLLKNRRIAILKLETTPGTMETLVDADADLLLRGDISMTKVLEEYTSKFATDDHDFDASIFGKRHGTVKIAWDLYMKTGVATTPKYDKLMNMCGASHTTYTTVGNGWKPDKLYDGKCGTIWVQTPRRGLNSAVMTKFKGCMGNLKIIVDKIGNPYRAEAEFKCVLDSIVDVATSNYLDITSADNDGVKAEAVIGTSITLGGTKQKVDKITFDMGNKIEMDIDAGDASGAGIAQFQIVGREPTIEIDPAAVAIADYDFWAAWKAGTLAAYLSKTTNISLKAPKAMIMSASEGDRGMSVTENLKLRLTRDATSAAPWQLLIGAET